MEYLMPEGLKAYMDAYHGQFSRKLAEWAIGKMRVKWNGKESPLEPKPIEQMEQALKQGGVKVSEECIYTAWYLYNMCFADYERSLQDDPHRAWYIDETLNDPDGTPGNVLACFRAKMDMAGVPIMWERMI